MIPHNVARWFATGLICSAGLAWAGGTNYDVYLVAGQSNMDGRGRVSELTNTLAKWSRPQLDVRIFFANPKLARKPDGPTSNTGWQTLAPGFSVPPRFSGSLPSSSFGPELSFARTLADKDPTRHIALVKVTEGGTSLAKEWNPATGRLYGTFTNGVRDALHELRTEGNSGTLRGMIWHQGESDVEGGDARYATNLVAFIARVRRDLGSPNLPFVIGEIATNKSASFRRAQASATNSLPCVGFANANGLQTYEGTHFRTPDVLELGRRYAAVAEVLLGASN